MSLAALVSFSGVFALGVIFAVLGSVKLKLARNLGLDDAQVGKLFAALMFSGLLASLIIGPLTDVLGYRAILLMGFGLSGVSLWMLACAGSYRAALIACLVLGVAGIGVNTGNVLGPTVLFGGQAPARASNLLNIFFGLGALLTPLVLAFLLGALGLKKSVALIGVILFMPILLPFFTVFEPPVRGFDLLHSARLLGNPAVLLGGMGLFCSIAVQSCLAGFITTYLKSHQFSDEKAGALLSGFWICLIMSRVMATFTPAAIDPAIMTPLLSAVMAAAIAVMIVAQSPMLGAVSALAAGFALGPIFPTLIGVSLAKTDAINIGAAGSVIGLIFAMGLCGGIIIPTLSGKKAVQDGIRRSFKISLYVTIALVVISGGIYLVPTVQAELPESVIEESPIPVPVIPESVVEEPLETGAAEAPGTSRMSLLFPSGAVGVDEKPLNVFDYACECPRSV